MGGEGDDRGWDGWMASATRWTWVWARSGSWWWTGRPGVLQSIGSQRVRYDWATELNWTDLIIPYPFPNSSGCFRDFPFSTMNSVKGLKMNGFTYILYILYTIRSLHVVFKGLYRKSYESIKFAWDSIISLFRIIHMIRWFFVFVFWKGYFLLFIWLPLVLVVACRILVTSCALFPYCAWTL